MPGTAPPRTRDLPKYPAEEAVSAALSSYDGSCSRVPYCYGLLTSSDGSTYFFARAHLIKGMMASSLKLGELLHFNVFDVANILCSGSTAWAFDVRRVPRRRWLSHRLKPSVDTYGYPVSPSLQAQAQAPGACWDPHSPTKLRKVAGAKDDEGLDVPLALLASREKQQESPSSKDKRLMPPPPVPPHKLRKVSSATDQSEGLPAAKQPTPADVASKRAQATGQAGNSASAKSGVDGSQESSEGKGGDEKITLSVVIRDLLQGRFETTAWSKSIEVYYGTPLIALLDFELKNINETIIHEAASLGMSASNLPVVKWAGVAIRF